MLPQRLTLSGPAKTRGGAGPWALEDSRSGCRSRDTGLPGLVPSLSPWTRHSRSSLPSTSLCNLGRVPGLGLASVSPPFNGMALPAASGMGRTERARGCWVLTWVRPHEDWVGKATCEQIPRVCGPGWSPSCVKAEGARYPGEAGWPCRAPPAGRGAGASRARSPEEVASAGPRSRLSIGWLLFFGELVLKTRKRETSEPRTIKHRSVL